MSNQKPKKIKEIKYETTETEEIRRFIVILLVVVFTVIGVYLLTKYVVKDETSKDSVTAGEINKDIVTVGTMLHKDASEYYVAIFDSETAEAVKVYGVINTYVQKENSLSVYYCNLGNELNKKYIAEDETKINESAKSIDELSLGSVTLIKVKNGKINKYYSGLEKIKEVLK